MEPKNAEEILDSLETVPSDNEVRTLSEFLDEKSETSDEVLLMLAVRALSEPEKLTAEYVLEVMRAFGFEDLIEDAGALVSQGTVLLEEDDSGEGEDGPEDEKEN